MSVPFSQVEAVRFFTYNSGTHENALQSSLHSPLFRSRDETMADATISIITGTISQLISAAFL